MAANGPICLVMSGQTPTPQHPDGRYYEALASRDARFDGRFFVGVRTTGVYCRPICPAPNPKIGNCAFFRTAAEAERRGFRPCKRCRPETAPASAAWLGTCSTVRRALRLIAEGALDEGSVDTLAGRLGVGGRHLRRLFERHVGAAPSELAATQRLHLARQLLTETRLPMTQVALASGYGSLRRFNGTFKSAYGVPPSRVRRGTAGGGAAPITLVLAYVPPYDWDGQLRFLRQRAIPGVECCAGGRYARTFALEGRPGVLRVANDARRHGLRVEVWIDGLVSLLPVVAGLRALFDLNAEPAAIGGTLGADGRLAPLVAAAPGLRVPGCWDPFELLVRAVLGQQITVSGARTLASRLVERFGRALAGGGEGPLGAGFHFPPPGALAEADIGAIGMPRRRAETIRSVARAVAEGSLRLDGGADPDVLERTLGAIPGIGAWTIGYVRLRALKDPDGFPVGDVALLRAARRLAIADTWPRLQAAAEAWRPWRAYATVHLWRSLAGGG